MMLVVVGSYKWANNRATWLTDPYNLGGPQRRTKSKWLQCPCHLRGHMWAKGVQARNSLGPSEARNNAEWIT